MSFEDQLDRYMGVAEDLLYSSPREIQQQVNYLAAGIRNWAIRHSPIYADYDGETVITKDDLQQKDRWYVEALQDRRVISSTSGSTTGDPFSYAITKKYAKWLLREQHWRLILREYGLATQRLKICILYRFKHTNIVFSKTDAFVANAPEIAKQAQYNHGSLDCEVDFINFERFETPGWYEQLFEYLDTTTPDVMISTGPIINQVCRQMRARRYDKPLCYLLSHTNEYPRQTDFQFLHNQKFIAHHCDHMRCWDGGAVFFTCRDGTYHLLDNVTQHRSVDDKLVTTDYFSLAAPFVNYWNGDLCRIDDTYQKCTCGRWYKPFVMLENRPFAIKGPTKLAELRKQISTLPFKQKIDQIQFGSRGVSIYTKRSLHEPEKQQLSCVLAGYNLSYFEENHE